MNLSAPAALNQILWKWTLFPYRAPCLKCLWHSSVSERCKAGGLKSTSRLWLFLFPLAGLLGHWDGVWSPPSSGGDAHAWLALASRSFCPPSSALRCPVFCRYSVKDKSMFHHFSTWSCKVTEGNQGGFKLSVGVFFETAEIVAKVLLFQQGSTENLPKRAGSVWLSLLEDNGGLGLYETKSGLETSPV